MLRIARAHPHLAAFMVRVGPPAVGAQSLATEYLPRDLADGVAAARFGPLHPRLAFDLVTGPVLAGFHTLLTATVPGTYPEDLAAALQRALGVPKAAARRFANLPLGELVLGAESLLVRAEALPRRRRAAGPAAT